MPCFVIIYKKKKKTSNAKIFYNMSLFSLTIMQQTYLTRGRCLFSHLSFPPLTNYPLLFSLLVT